MRKLVSAICIAAACWLLLCAALGVLMMQFALHSERRPLTIRDRQLAAAIAGQYHATLTSV